MPKDDKCNMSININADGAMGLELQELENESPSTCSARKKVSSKKSIVKGTVETAATSCTILNKNEKKALRWTWRKPKDKPCRPLSAYNLFFADMRKVVLEEQKTSGGFGNLARIVSDRWKSVPENIKSKYQKQADILKDEYQVALSKWKKNQESQEYKLEKKTSDDEQLQEHLEQDNATIHEEVESMELTKRKQTINTEKRKKKKIRTSRQPEIVHGIDPIRVTEEAKSIGIEEPASACSPSRVSASSPNIPEEATSNPITDCSKDQAKAQDVGKVEPQRGIAVVTGGRSGIGKALALKIASFPSIDYVLLVTRSVVGFEKELIQPSKIQVLEADICTEDGRQVVVDQIKLLCHGEPTRNRQLRFLIHCAASDDQVKSTFDIRPYEIRDAMSFLCEAPIFLTTALYPYMVCDNEESGIACRVLHVSNGSNKTHLNSKSDFGLSVDEIAKEAFFHSYRALEKECRVSRGGKVVLGSFKTGLVDIPCGHNRNDPRLEEAMLMVDMFNSINENAEFDSPSAPLHQQSQQPQTEHARPTLAGVFDTPENAANFAEYLLLGTSDTEFSNDGYPHEYGIRKKKNNGGSNHHQHRPSSLQTAKPPTYHMTYYWPSETVLSLAAKLER